MLSLVSSRAGPKNNHQMEKTVSSPPWRIGEALPSVICFSGKQHTSHSSRGSACGPEGDPPGRGACSVPREGLRQVQGRAASLNPSPPLYALGLNFCSSETVCVLGAGEAQACKMRDQTISPTQVSGWLDSSRCGLSGWRCMLSHAVSLGSACSSIYSGPQMVNNSPTMRETWVRSLGWEDPLEKGIATHSIILAWRIPVHGVAKSWTQLSEFRFGLP